MAERGASVPYSGAPPAPSGLVAQNGSGAQSMRVDASPDAFGGSVSAGLNKLGNVGEDFAQRATGMVMETAANQAELEYTKQTSPIVAKYKSLQGLEAYAATPKFEEEILKVNQNIRSNLPGGAQRMFDASTARSARFAISDYQSYATTQLKRATLDSTNAIGEAAVTRAGSPDIAADETQWGHVVGDVKHSVASMMELQGWSGYATTNPETGKVTFSDTPEGKQAQAVYQSELDKRIGPAWENRLRTLADQNVPGAYEVFKQNRDSIPGESQIKMEAYFTPKMRDYDARTTADGVVASHAQEYRNSLLTPKVASRDIADVIHQQEAQGRSTSKTSIDGARGGWQIMPDTFKLYARPGENIDNPKDNEIVGRRIVADLSDKFNGDPARIAVGYFSGEGNVAPLGSATPWKVDHKDGNGKKTSSYVEDVLKLNGVSKTEKDYSFLDTKLSSDQENKFQEWKSKYAPKDSGADYDLRGAFAKGYTPDQENGHFPDEFKKPNHPTFSDQSKFAKDYPELAGRWAADNKTFIPPIGKQEVPTTGLIPSEADYFRANYASMVEETRQHAETTHPDDPSYADNAVARVEQRMAASIKGQEMAYKADNDMVLKAAQGGFSREGSLPPRSMEELKAISPDVGAALDRMAVNDWKAYEHVQNKILVANARGNDKDMREYGRGFYKLFQAVHADASDPNRVNNVKQLYEHIGPDGDLTMAGLDKLNTEINGKNTPEGAAEGDMRKHFFENAKSQISGKNDLFGLPDSKGEEQYLKFMAQTFPLIEKLRSEGKTASQIYNPDSPDYVGKLIPAFKRPLNIQMQDMQRDAQGLGGASTGGGISQQVQSNAVRTPAKIAAEARATTDPQRREELKRELIKMGVIRDDSAQVPGPE